MNSILRNNNDDTFIFYEHPIKEQILENKIMYLYGLGLIIDGDTFNELEKKFIRALLRTADLTGETLKEIETNAKFIDDGFVEEFKNILKENNLSGSFIYDSIMMCFEIGSDFESKKHVVNRIRNIFRISNDQLAVVINTLKAIDSSDICDLENLEGKEYWKWSHLLEYKGINYTPESIYISSQIELRELIDSRLFSPHIKLAQFGFRLSQADIDKLNDAKITGSGNPKMRGSYVGQYCTTIWLEGGRETFNEHSHEINMSMLNLTSISNCHVGTIHPKVQVVTRWGEKNLFNNCHLQEVSEIDWNDKKEMKKL